MLAAMQLEDETSDTFSIVSHFDDGITDFHAIRGNRKDFRVGDEVPIAVKRVGQLRSDYVSKVIEYAEKSFFGRILLILYGELTPVSKRLLADAENVHVVQLDGSLSYEDAVDQVKQGLRAAFRVNPEPDN